MTTNPVGWFEIYTENLERAQKFYETVFDIKLEQLDAPVPGIQMLAFPMEMGLPGAAGALCKMDGVPAGANSTMVYFNCDDCATEASRVESAGGRLERDKMSIGQHGFIAIAADTEGNMIGLHSQT